MTAIETPRGGAPVGVLSDLADVEAAAVICLRLWCDGPDSKAAVRADFTDALGPEGGARAMREFEQLLGLCARHGRRPLMRHGVHCKCVGADEACFANCIAAAAEGDLNDAMLIATLLVRPDMAPMAVPLAAAFGLALRRMMLAASRDLPPQPLNHATLH